MGFGYPRQLNELNCQTQNFLSLPRSRTRDKQQTTDYIEKKKKKITRVFKGSEIQFSSLSRNTTTSLLTLVLSPDRLLSPPSGQGALCEKEGKREVPREAGPQEAARPAGSDRTFTAAQQGWQNLQNPAAEPDGKWGTTAQAWTR